MLQHVILRTAITNRAVAAANGFLGVVDVSRGKSDGHTVAVTRSNHTVAGSQHLRMGDLANQSVGSSKVVRADGNDVEPNSRNFVDVLDPS